MPRFPPVLLATVRAFSSAFLHAAWNLIIKRSDDRELAAWGQFLAGARHTDSGFVYTSALMIVASLTLSTAGVVRGRARDFIASVPVMWRRYVVSGAFLTTAYGLVLVAVRFAPVGYVATLRESSVVLGAVVGWLFLGEEFGRRRLVSSVVVAAGLVALVAFR